MDDRHLPQWGEGGGKSLRLVVSAFAQARLGQWHWHKHRALPCHVVRKLQSCHSSRHRPRDGRPPPILERVYKGRTSANVHSANGSCGSNVRWQSHAPATRRQWRNTARVVEWQRCVRGQSRLPTTVTLGQRQWDKSSEARTAHNAVGIGSMRRSANSARRGEEKLCEPVGKYTRLREQRKFHGCLM